jgi:hypothetical protein
MPNDQPTEYLPTQAIADFLATAEYPPLPLDGIAYPSAQAGHRGPFERSNRSKSGLRQKENFNVVLFHKAARVRRLDEGADISVSDNSCSLAGFENVDSPDVQYFVSVSAEQRSAADNTRDDDTLKFTSLEVRYVKAVEFATICSSISRFYAEKRD